MGNIVPKPENASILAGIFVLPSSLVPKLFRIRIYEKHARNPFGILTSEMRDLKSFRIRIYRKKEEGVASGSGVARAT